MTDKYRIVFAVDGIHWIDHKDNDYKDPAEAVMRAREFCCVNHLAKAQVVNAKTKFKIWDSEEEVKNHPDCMIAQSRKAAAWRRG